MSQRAKFHNDDIQPDVLPYLKFLKSSIATLNEDHQSEKYLDAPAYLNIALRIACASMVALGCLTSEKWFAPSIHSISIFSLLSS